MRKSILISETNLNAETKRLLEKAGLTSTEAVANYCYCNDGLRYIKGIGVKKQQEIESLLVQEGWKCHPDSYDRLYFKACGKPDDEDELLVFFYRSPETDEVFEDVLGMLTDREQAVLRDWFGIGHECLKLDTIAKKSNISREQTRQIIAKALRKIRHPSRARKFKNIRYSWQELSELYDEYYKKARSLETEVRRLRGILEENGITVKEPIEGPISELGLSVRVDYSLRRASITTIEELSKLSRKDLSKVRNLGQRGIDEIVTKLKERGVTLPN